MVEIANAVGSGDIGVELDIAEVAADLSVPYTEYDPENYHGLYVRLVEDEPLITLYRSGKYIISGCSSFEELNETNHAFLQVISELDGIETSLETGFTVQNVVCTGALQQPVNLNALAIGFIGRGKLNKCILFVIPPPPFLPSFPSAVFFNFF